MGIVTTPDDIDQMWISYKADEAVELRNRLVEIYLPLVKYNGARIWARLPKKGELDDLVSAGVFGLMDAIDAFDLSRGVKFETYCISRIRGAMLDELRTMDWVPRLVRSKAGKLNQAVRTLEARHGRQPTEAELAAELGISIRELEKMILDANPVETISLYVKWYETDSYKEVRDVDVLADKRAELPEQRLDLLDELRTILRGLSKDERILIVLYYYEGQTMREIGRQIGRSESRVSQMHSELMVRLRDRFRSVNLGKAYPKNGHQTH